VISSTFLYRDGHKVKLILFFLTETGMNPKIKLLQEPVVPVGWREMVQEKRRDRRREREYKTGFGIDSFIRPWDPLGHWIVFIRITTSSTKMTDSNGNLVFDKRTRRPRMVYEYGFLPLIVDVDDTVENLYRRIEDAGVQALRHQTFHLEVNDIVMDRRNGILDGYHYPIDDESVIFCIVEEKRRY